MAPGQNVTNAAASGRLQVSPSQGTLSLKNKIVFNCVTLMFKIYLKLFFFYIQQVQQLSQENSLDLAFYFTVYFWLNL